MQCRPSFRALPWGPGGSRDRDPALDAARGHALELYQPASASVDRAVDIAVENFVDNFVLWGRPRL